MPDLLESKEIRSLNKFHYGDIVFLTASILEAIPRINERDEEVYVWVPSGQYVVGNWAKINGIDVRLLGLRYEDKGRALMNWYSVPPETDVYILQESWQ